MNIKLNMPQEMVEVFAMFFGSVLIASVLSGSTFFLIQNKLPPHSLPLPIWLAVWFWLSAIFIATQVQNILLRLAILSWVIGKVFTWLCSGNEGLATWLVHNGFFLLAGVIMVVVGVRKSRIGVCIGAVLLLIGLSVFQYTSAVNWAIF